MDVWIDLVPVAIVVAALAYTYACAGVVIAAVSWFEADRPRWRMLHWARAVALGPAVYLQLAIGQWRTRRRG